MRLSFMVMLSCLAWPGAVAPGDSTRSADGSTASLLISYSRSGGPALQFAANELARYVEAMTGQKGRVSDEGPAGMEESFRLDIDSTIPPDGYHVRLDNKRILINGGDSRGCLYGVYAWLYDMGCRWPLPGKDYEIVPWMTSIDWKGPELKSAPAIRRRGMVYCIIDPNDRSCLELVDFLAKNGFNYLFLHVGSLSGELRDHLARMLNEREMGFEYGGHILAPLLPREEFDRHPDYFRMVKGQRVRELNMCPSNDEAVELIARNARSRYLDDLRKDVKRLETLHLWPDDLVSGGWCDCPKCKGYTESEQSLMILDKLARRLPLDGTMLGHCAYHATMEPPARIKATHGVRLVYAPRERSYRFPLGQGRLNQWYVDKLKELIRLLPEEPEVFEYYHDMVLFRFLPMPLHRVIGEDVKAYKAAGIDGISSLSFSLYYRWAYGPNSYLLGRALWWGEGRDDDIREYCRCVFGPAAEPAMTRYFDLLYELCATAMDTGDYEGFMDLRELPPNQPGVVEHGKRLAPLVRPEHLDMIAGRLDEASAAAREPYLARIEQQRLLWRFARLEATTIYKGIIASPILFPALDSSATPEMRREAAARLEDILKGIDDANEIIRQVPEELKGLFAVDGHGAYNERAVSYKYKLKVWLEKLRQ